MQPMIWVASAKRLLGPSPGRPLRRKCNRIGSPARQAFRSRTTSASLTFSNASRPFLNHQRQSQPNDSATAQADFGLARSRPLRGLPRNAGPRGFQAYDADGQLIGLFHDKQAAIEAITAAST